MTLTEFLLTRIAEDEAVAHKLAETDRRPLLSVALTVNHPARVLAECEAKRRIVGRHSLHPYYPVCEWCYVDDPDFRAAPYPCVELRDLAAVYADHPDYDEAWRP